MILKKKKVTELKIRNYTAVLSIRLSSAVLKSVTHFCLFSDRNSRNISETDLQKTSSSDTKDCYHS